MSWTREQLLEEIGHNEADLRAFKASRSALHERLLEIEGTPHHEFLADWAGTQVLLNAFIMVITRCEGLIEDMRANLAKMEPERPALRLVNGDKDDDGSG